MANYIGINLGKAKPYVGELKSTSGKLKTAKFQASLIQQALRFDDGLKKCEPALKRVINTLNTNITHLQGAENAFREILRIYEQAENGIVGADFFRAGDSINDDGSKYHKDKNWWTKILSWFGFGDPFTEDEIDSVVYDDDGSYGGNQGSPKSEWGLWSEKEELYDIVRDYYPNMTDKEISDYLKKLNSEGCGYVAVINTIFAEYEGREADFERDFGFPMYNKDGDLNYDKLLVDFYSATDNHNPGRNGSDVYNTNEDPSNVKGTGTSGYDREYRLNKYLEDKNASITFEQTYHDQNEITTDNFMEYAEKGHVVISFRYGNLQNEDGSTAQYINGGHAMEITGVTSDGRFIVSSWGEKYYIDPNDIITRQDNEGKSHTTNFEFQLIDYERR